MENCYPTLFPYACAPYVKAIQLLKLRYPLQLLLVPVHNTVINFNSGGLFSFRSALNLVADINYENQMYLKESIEDGTFFLAKV